jgi:integrase/recombinase XerD
MGEAATVRGFPAERQDTVSAFLAGCRSDETRNAYRRDLADFDAFLGKAIEEASRLDVEAWISTLRDAGMAPATVNRKVSAVRSYLRLLLDEGIIARNPANHARTPTVAAESSTPGLSKEEARAMLAACDDSTVGRRDRALLALLLFQALRVSEAVGASVEDLGDDSGYPVLRVNGKGGKVVRVPLTPATVATLRKWLETAELEDGALLRSVKKGGRVDGALSRSGAFRRIRFLAKRAGIEKKISPHSLRHTAITLALDGGVSLRHVQDFARHADPRTTRRYDLRRNSLNNPSGAAVVAAIED